MGSQIKLLSPDQRVVVDVRGPGEWIVHSPAGGRSLHVYRLAPADWLVSEVGRGSEGRGTDLRQALATLSAGVPPPEWWDVAAETLYPAPETQA
jgi:sarcosine oxidase gamma subunit